MIYFYHDRGWRISRDDIEIAGPFDNFDAAVEAATERGWMK